MGGCHLIILYDRGAVRVFAINILHQITILCIKCDPTWDLVPLGENVDLLVDELYFLVVKTICKYSF